MGTTIYLTEQSIRELLKGLPIFDEEGTPYETRIIPPKTNELGLTYTYKAKWYQDHLNEVFICEVCDKKIKRKDCYGFFGELDKYCKECYEVEKKNREDKLLTFTIYGGEDD